ncbi:MAG: EamA family transporter [Gaiellaceae bacterium]
MGQDERHASGGPIRAKDYPRAALRPFPRPRRRLRPRDVEPAPGARTRSPGGHCSRARRLRRGVRAGRGRRLGCRPGRLAVRRRLGRPGARVLRAPRRRLPAGGALRRLPGGARARAGARARRRHRSARRGLLGGAGGRGVPHRRRRLARARLWPAPRLAGRLLRRRHRCLHRRLHARRRPWHRVRERDLLPRAHHALPGGRLRGGRGRLEGPAVVAGLATFVAYALVLAALDLAAAAPVAAVRETSVVIATAGAAFVLRERVGPGRLAGAILVAGGVALLAV